MDKAPDVKFLNDPRVRLDVTSPLPPSPPSQAHPPMDKVRVINRSLQCYTLSWFGLIPLLGLAPALLALRLHWRIRKEAGPEWNPAHKYDAFGTTLAFWGLLISLILWALLFGAALDPS